jgi:hypothetical protein
MDSVWEEGSKRTITRREVGTEGSGVLYEDAGGHSRLVGEGVTVGVRGVGVGVIPRTWNAPVHPTSAERRKEIKQKGRSSNAMGRIEQQN